MAILAGTGFSKNTDSYEAGRESAKMAGEYVKDPHLLILFASIFHNQEMVLKGVRSIIKDTPLIGGSSFGEMTNYGMNDHSVVLMAIKADKIKFSLGLGNDSDKNPVKSGEEAAREALKDAGKKEVQTGIFISEMLGSSKTLKGVQNVLGKEVGLFGGCCSGNRKVPISDPEFASGYQYLNERVYRHSIPLLLLSGDFKYSFGVGHGWRSLGKVVTTGRTEKNTIYEIDHRNAIDFYKHYLGESSFVPYPLGFYQNGQLILRATTGTTAEKDGLVFTTEIPSGTEVRITKGSRVDILKSSEETAKQTLDGLKGAKPRLGIIASCISRHTMLGTKIHKELEVIQGVLGKDVPLIGFYCAGEYAPVSGSNFYHNFSFCLYLLGEETADKPKKVAIKAPEKPGMEKDKILIITKKENLVSDCKTALTELEIDFEWIKDKIDLEDSLKNNIPRIVILEVENEQLIPGIKKTEQDIQIILLIEKEREASSKEIIRKLGESICGFCPIPFRMFELQFLFKKALAMNKMYIKNRIVEAQLIETKEYLDEAEESIEVREKVLMETYSEIEMAKNGLAEQVKERTKELEKARNGLEIKVRERTEELQKSEKRFRDVVLSMADWIWEVDEKGLYTYCSENIKDILGYTKEEIIGKTPFDLMPPTEAEKIGKIFSEIIKNKELIKNVENWNLTKDGRRVCLLTNGVPLLDEQGNLKGYRGIDKDITGRKQAEKEKEKLQMQLLQAEKMAAVGQLAGGVAHEINNPMGIILGFAQVIAKGIKEDNPFYMPLKSIEREAIRCKKLVENLLTFSRIGKTGTEITDINKAIDETLSLVEAQTKVKNIVLVKEYSPDLPKITVNKNQLQQVIVNLCNNAIDAMPGGGKITITTILTQPSPLKGEGKYMEISIADTGTGMTEEVKQHLFEPFFTTKEVGKGTGLGLSLCYEIIGNHKGEIFVESEPGKGTRFIIKLPVI